MGYFNIFKVILGSSVNPSYISTNKVKGCQVAAMVSYVFLGIQSSLSLHFSTPTHVPLLIFSEGSCTKFFLLKETSCIQSTPKPLDTCFWPKTCSLADEAHQHSQLPQGRLCKALKAKRTLQDTGHLATFLILGALT